MVEFGKGSVGFETALKSVLELCGLPCGKFGDYSKAPLVCSYGLDSHTRELLLGYFGADGGGNRKAPDAVVNLLSEQLLRVQEGKSSVPLSR